LPAFRSDNAMNVDDVNEFNNYLTLVEKSSDISISTYNDYIAALKRHDYFVHTAFGKRLDWRKFMLKITPDRSRAWYKIRSGVLSLKKEIQSAMLVTLAEWIGKTDLYSNIISAH
jgi:glucuronate isomerase